MTDAVGLVPLISFFHPQRLWLLAAVPLLLLLYFGLLQRSRTIPVQCRESLPQ